MQNLSLLTVSVRNIVGNAIPVMLIPFSDQIQNKIKAHGLFSKYIQSRCVRMRIPNASSYQTNYFFVNNLSILLVKLQVAYDTINIQQKLPHELFNPLTASKEGNSTMRK